MNNKNQCIGYIKSGGRCSRMIDNPNKFCWQHEKQLEEKRIETFEAVKPLIAITAETGYRNRDLIGKALIPEIVEMIRVYIDIPRNIGKIFEPTYTQKWNKIIKYFERISDYYLSDDLNTKIKILAKTDIDTLYSLSVIFKSCTHINQKMIKVCIQKELNYLSLYDYYLQDKSLNEIAYILVYAYTIKANEFFYKFYTLFITRFVKEILTSPNCGSKIYGESLSVDVRTVLQLVILDIQNDVNQFTVSNNNSKKEKYKHFFQNYMCIQSIVDLYSIAIPFKIFIESKLTNSTTKNSLLQPYIDKVFYVYPKDWSYFVYKSLEFNNKSTRLIDLYLIRIHINMCAYKKENIYYDKNNLYHTYDMDFEEAITQNDIQYFIYLKQRLNNYFLPNIGYFILYNVQMTKNIDPEHDFIQYVNNIIVKQIQKYNPDFLNEFLTL